MNFIHVVRKYMPGHILAYTASLLLGIRAIGTKRVVYVGGLALWL